MGGKVVDRITTSDVHPRVGMANRTGGSLRESDVR